MTQLTNALIDTLAEAFSEAPGAEAYCDDALPMLQAIAAWMTTQEAGNGISQRHLQEHCKVLINMLLTIISEI